MDGDYIAIQLDTSVKIPESAVDIHCKVKKTLSRYVHLFTKCVGQLDFPFHRFELCSEAHEQQQKYDQFELAEIFNDVLYPCRIMDMFENSQ